MKKKSTLKWLAKILAALFGAIATIFTIIQGIEGFWPGTISRWKTGITDEIKSVLGMNIPIWIPRLILILFIVLFLFIIWFSKKRKISGIDKNLKVNLMQLSPTNFKKLYGMGNKIKDLSKLISKGSTSLIAIKGVAGSGKTSLVTFLLNKIAPEYYESEYVFCWTFSKKSSMSSESSGLESSTNFWDSALRFFNYEGPESKSNIDKARALFSELQDKKCILFIDNLEYLQRGTSNDSMGCFADDVMRGFLAMICREHLKSGSTVITASRLPFPELDQFRNNSDNYVVINEKDLRMKDEAGLKLIESNEIKGSRKQKISLVKKMGGHGLTLDLACRAIAGQQIDISKAQRIIERNEDRIAAVAEFYIETWEQDSMERMMLYILSLFFQPATLDEIIYINKGINQFTFSGDDVNRIIKELVKTGLVIEKSQSDQIVYFCHALVRNHFSKIFKELKPLDYKNGHNILFIMYSEKATFNPQSIDELQPLYRAVQHGCLAEEYENAFKDIYLPRISRERKFFNVAKLGDRSGDLQAISCFFPNGFDEPKLKVLNDITSAWLLAKAAFDSSALGRFEESRTIRKNEIEIFRSLGLIGIAAEDSRRLMNTLVPLGRLEEALHVGEDAEALANENLRSKQNKSPTPFLKLGNPRSILDRCIAEKAFVLFLMGKEAECETELKKVTDAEEQFYQSWIRLHQMKSYNGNELQLFTNNLSSGTGEGVPEGNINLILASIKRREKNFDGAEKFIRHAERIFNNLSRLDLRIRTIVERAKLNRDRWLESKTENWLKLCRNDLNEIKDFVRFSNAKLFEVDISLIELEIQSEKKTSLSLNESLSELKQQIASMSYGFAHKAYQRIEIKQIIRRN